MLINFYPLNKGEEEERRRVTWGQGPVSQGPCAFFGPSAISELSAPDGNGFLRHLLSPHPQDIKSL